MTVKELLDVVDPYKITVYEVEVYETFENQYSEVSSQNVIRDVSINENLDREISYVDPVYSCGEASIDVYLKGEK